MSSYKIEIAAQDQISVTLKVAFGVPAQNDEIILCASNLMDELTIPHGRVVKVNGPASLPVAMLLAHTLAHISKAVACYDPKMAAYVVAITHDPAYPLGSLIE